MPVKSTKRPTTKRPVARKRVSWSQKVTLALKSPRFQNGYALASVAILLGTTVFWSLLTAKINFGNADQLVDPLLFRDHQTFAGAQFPGAHTFLLKWPLFFIIALFHFSSVAYTVATVGLALVTVVAVIYGLYRIDRRPLPFGTITLALASILLLVPAQPYAGALLPVNLAMVATRNIEYVLYAACLHGLASSFKIRNRRFWLATLGFGLLFASDKLFLTFSLVGSLIVIIVYGAAQVWKFVSLGVNWLVSTVIAAGLASALLAAINGLHITHIVSGTSPYSFTSTVHDGVLGTIYAITGSFTNFGANPAYDALDYHQFISTFSQHFLSLSLLGYSFNVLVLTAAAWAVWKLGKITLIKKGRAATNFGPAGRTVLLLTVSGAAALILFVGAKHYYPVDARYVGILLFSGITAICFSYRKSKIAPEKLCSVGLVCIVGLALAIPSALQSSRTAQAAASSDTQRNYQVAQALAHHHVTTLIGDYWRVVPIKLQIGATNIQPLADCTTVRNSLVSTNWSVNLRHHSFAYLLSNDASRTDFPHCTSDQVTAKYGRPNSSLLLAGSFQKPKEQLLFYDRGIGVSLSGATARSLSQGTVSPVDLADFPYGACYTPTIMNIVAHQDDDLLFLSPDLLHTVQSGSCVRTVFLTAGDGGNGLGYATGRQQGAEAAYSQMLGNKKDWIERTVKVSNNRYITIANPRMNSKISLVFVHLPDGNLRGDGFRNTGHQSLAKLRDGKIPALETVDRQSSFTSTQLIATLSALMHLYQPAQINTQADVSSVSYGDHSDHLATKWFVDQARDLYHAEQFNNSVSIPIHYYIGYPVRDQPINVFGNDYSQKETTFLEYAHHDGGVCNTIDSCDRTPTYGSYLERQYQQ